MESRPLASPVALVLLLLAGCSSAPSPELSGGEPPGPGDSAKVAEVRSIAQACAEKDNQTAGLAYRLAPDPDSVRRTGASETWLIEMVEQEPYMGRLPPPAPPRRYVVRVNTAARSCTALPPEQ